MDKCVSMGPSMAKLGIRYTFKTVCPYLFLAEKRHSSWHGAVHFYNVGFHLIVILCWLLNMQCHQMKGFPFDLVFHSVARSLNCR